MIAGWTNPKMRIRISERAGERLRPVRFLRAQIDISRPAVLRNPDPVNGEYGPLMVFEHGVPAGTMSVTFIDAHAFDYLTDRFGRTMRVRVNNDDVPMFDMDMQLVRCVTQRAAATDATFIAVRFRPVGQGKRK